MSFNAMVPAAIFRIQEDFPAKAFPSTHALIGKGGNSGGGGAGWKNKKSLRKAKNQNKWSIFLTKYDKYITNFTSSTCPAS